MLKEDLKSELYLEIGSNNYSYALVYPSHDKKIEAYHSETLIFNDLEKDLLQTSFVRTKISLGCQKFTFIPTEIFNSADLGIYTPYLQATANETIFTYNLPDLGFTAVYALENLILDKLERHFPEAVIYPQFIPFLLATNKLQQKENTTNIFVNFKSNSLEIALFKNNKFQFYNNFLFENEDEAIYFILLVAQQNALVLADLNVTLSGEIKIERDLIQKIKAHLPNTSLVNQQNLSAFYQNSNPVEFSNYFSLLSLYLCA